MEDPTDPTKLVEAVAKIVESEVVNKAYDDLAASPLREGGKFLTDLAKSFRLFTAPIQLLAVAQDRLAAFCDRVRAKVPEDRQQEAAPSIALPVLMDLRFMEDENPLTELYLNLLARAIDKERCNEAHPAFVKIIEQLSPDEAMVLWHFRQTEHWNLTEYEGCDAEFPTGTLAEPRKLQSYIEHLKALSLLKVLFIKLDGKHNIRLTKFGKQFIQACVPENLDVLNFRTSPDSR